MTPATRAWTTCVAGPAAPSCRPALAEGGGIHPAATAPPALAHRHLVPEHLRDVLLPLLDHRRLQPLPRPLGNPRDAEATRGGNRRGAGTGEVSRRESADHQRQRSAVRGQGLQGVPPPLRADPRTDLALLSAEQGSCFILHLFGTIGDKRGEGCAFREFAAVFFWLAPLRCSPLQH